MKKDIHPELKMITVVMTNGEQRLMPMALPDNQTKLHLDVDPFNHPAWQKGAEKTLLDTSGQVSKFQKKYGDFL